jgi:hypothetical protein
MKMMKKKDCDNDCEKKKDYENLEDEERIL